MGRSEWHRLLVVGGASIWRAWHAPPSIPHDISSLIDNHMEWKQAARLGGSAKDRSTYEQLILSNSELYNNQAMSEYHESTRTTCLVLSGLCRQVWDSCSTYKPPSAAHPRCSKCDHRFHRSDTERWGSGRCKHTLVDFVRWRRIVSLEDKKLRRKRWLQKINSRLKIFRKYFYGGWTLGATVNKLSLLSSQQNQRINTDLSNVKCNNVIECNMVKKGIMWKSSYFVAR